MEKKFELDEELDVFLEKQLLREAELLEKELLSKEDSEPYTETEEEMQASYASLIERLKSDGVYREDVPVSETASAGKKKTMEITSLKTGGTQQKLGSIRKMSARRESMTEEEKHRRRRRISAKIAGVVVVSGMCVFAASMTSEANRNYFAHSVKIMTGRDTRVVMDNDEMNEKANTDESTAIATIEQELGIEMPEFLYRPCDFIFVSYEVDTYAELAWVEYEYNGSILSLCMNRSKDDSMSNISGMIGEEMPGIEILYENIEVSIVQVKDENDELSGYYAKWKRKDVNYSIYGRMELEEFDKMIKNIAY